MFKNFYCYLIKKEPVIIAILKLIVEAVKRGKKNSLKGEIKSIIISREFQRSPIQKIYKLLL